MGEKYFLTQIKHDAEGFAKGVVVKDTLDGARQSFHAYLGAYGYGNAAGVDYVACYIMDTVGRVTDSVVDDRRPVPEV
ncbi:MAG: hypothetical protein IKY66_07525 [Bacteroidales bacterium]|nr:hypothetical protein [Bacteroidales bacterium]